MEFLGGMTPLLISSWPVVRHYNSQEPLYELCYLAAGASVPSGFSSLFVKTIAEIVKGCAWWHWLNDVCDPATHAFALGIPACVLVQLQPVGLGLQNFGTLKFMAIYRASVVMSNVVVGLVLFNETQGYTKYSASLFDTGFVLATPGVQLLVVKALHEGDGLLEDIDLVDDSLEDSLWILKNGDGNGSKSVESADIWHTSQTS